MIQIFAFFPTPKSIEKIMQNIAPTLCSSITISWLIPPSWLQFSMFNNTENGVLISALRKTRRGEKQQKFRHFIA